MEDERSDWLTGDDVEVRGGSKAFSLRHQLPEDIIPWLSTWQAVRHSVRQPRSVMGETQPTPESVVGGRSLIRMSRVNGGQ